MWRFGLKNLYILLIELFVFCACENIDVSEEGVPLAVQDFVSQYFPGGGISRLVIDKDEYYITIEDGPDIVIRVKNPNSTEYTVVLLSFTGNGYTMPENMAYNLIPEELYNYISGIESLNQIYDYEFTNAMYKVTLQNTIVTYDSSTNTIEEN